MRAFVIDQPGETSLIDISEPAIGERDVLLRVRTVGFCGTDLSTFRGVNPLVSYPRIPGHELGCTIEAAGRRGAGRVSHRAERAGASVSELRRVQRLPAGPAQLLPRATRRSACSATAA